MDAAIITEILRRLRSENEVLGLSPGEYFELLMRMEDFKGFLDRLGSEILEGLQMPRPAYGPPPAKSNVSRGTKAAWPQRNLFGVGDPAIGIALSRSSHG